MVRGITGEVADAIYEKLAAFANFGFPESHSVSFAYLVYASSYLKRYFPAAFCAGLLDAQPMGFYAPHTLVADARRHGVDVCTPDINLSIVGASLDWRGAPTTVDAFPIDGVDVAQPMVRLGLSSVRSVGDALAAAIVDERVRNGDYRSIDELAHRVEVPRVALEALATAGAFEHCGTEPLDRRRALWSAGAAAQGGPDRLPGIVTGIEAPTLPGLSESELGAADLWATGVAPGRHPTVHLRAELDAMGVRTAVALRETVSGSRVLVGGVVTHRQRPGTAKGVTFLNLEDETGLINVICSPGLWQRHRRSSRPRCWCAVDWSGPRV